VTPTGHRLGRTGTFSKLAFSHSRRLLVFLVMGLPGQGSSTLRLSGHVYGAVASVVNMGNHQRVLSVTNPASEPILPDLPVIESMLEVDERSIRGCAAVQP
jgi:hypothetical protein